MSNVINMSNADLVESIANLRPRRADEPDLYNARLAEAARRGLPGFMPPAANANVPAPVAPPQPAAASEAPVAAPPAPGPQPAAAATFVMADSADPAPPKTRGRKPNAVKEAAATAALTERLQHHGPIQRGSTVAEVARGYVDQGFHVVQLKPRSKDPTGSWKDKPRYEDCHQLFDGGGCNIALAFGATGAGLVDLDLDWEEAARIGDIMFGSSPSYGRPGKLRSHRVQICPETVSAPDEHRIVTFKLPSSMKGTPGLPDEHSLCVCELRGNGHYSMVPPSTHPNGEPVTWDTPNASIKWAHWDDLKKHIGLLAFVAVMARFYPPLGYRRDFCLAVTGALLRAIDAMKLHDSDEELCHVVDRTVEAIGDLAGSRGDSHKKGFAERTLSLIRGGKKATGLKTICKILGHAELLKTFHEWLGDDSDERAYVKVDELNLPKSFTDIHGALVDAGANVFQQSGGRLVYKARLDETEETAGGKRHKGTLTILPITPDTLASLWQEHIRFVVMVHDKKKHTVEPKIQAPDDPVIRKFMARKDMYVERILRGISDIPILRSDGTICDTEGYDEQSGMILDFNGVEYPAIPANPTKEEALAALGVVSEVIKGFPFDGLPPMTKCPSRSVALSLLLSVLVSQNIKAVPMHFIDAPEAGSGKSLVIQCAGIIATGQEPPSVSWHRTEEENEKRLVGSFRRGGPLLFIDNVKKGSRIYLDFLCSAITGAMAETRTLGKTGGVIVPTNMAVAASGNNIGPDGDLCRRSLKATIDAKMPRPQERKFKVNLHDYCREHRTELVVALLTILRAFIVAPEAERQAVFKMREFGNFDEWNRLVRAPLIWLGEADPYSIETVQEDNAEANTLAELMVAWRDCGDLGLRDPSKDEPKDAHGWFTSTDVLDVYNRNANGALIVALDHIFAAPRHPSPNGFGMYIRGLNGKVMELGTQVLRFESRVHPVLRNTQYALVEVMPQAEMEFSNDRTT